MSIRVFEISKNHIRIHHFNYIHNYDILCIFISNQQNLEFEVTCTEEFEYG